MVARWRTRIATFGLTPCLIGLMLLAGCRDGSTIGLRRNATPTTSVTAPTATNNMMMNTATPVIQPTENLCTDPTPTPPPPATTPQVIAPSGWATYTSSDYHYSIQYPANWPYEPAQPPTSMVFDVRNYVQSQYSGAGEARPPLHSIEVIAYPNSSGFSAHDFYVNNHQVNPLDAPACSQTTYSVTLAGRAALEMVQHPVHWQNGVIDLISVTYYIPDGTNMLILDENYSPNGQPSDILAHMIASLTISG